MQDLDSALPQADPFPSPMTMICAIDRLNFIIIRHKQTKESLEASACYKIDTFVEIDG